MVENVDRNAPHRRVIQYMIFYSRGFLDAKVRFVDTKSKIGNPTEALEG